MKKLSTAIPRPRTRAGKIVTGATVLVVAGGAAFAYWTAGGTGTGTADTGSTTTALVVNQVSEPTDMRPGDSAQTLSGTFTNDNNEPVYVGKVIAALDSVTRASGAVGACTTDDYTLAGATMEVDAEIPAGTGTGAWSGATVKFNNKAEVNQDGCKGATLNLSYTINSDQIDEPVVN